MKIPVYKIVPYLKCQQAFTLLTSSIDLQNHVRTNDLVTLFLKSVKYNFLKESLWEKIGNEDIILKMMEISRIWKEKALWQRWMHWTSCLFWSCKFGHAKVAEHLFDIYGSFERAIEDDAPMSVQYSLNRALEVACFYGHVLLVPLLLQNGTNVTDASPHLLPKAIVGGSVKIVKLLLENGVKVHSYDIVYAIHNENDDILDLLLQEPSTGEFDLDSLLSTACEYGDVRIVEVLVEKGVHVSKRHLQIASDFDHKDVLLLLKK
jgi:hypothetical protein